MSKIIKSIFLFCIGYVVICFHTGFTNTVIKNSIFNIFTMIIDLLFLFLILYVGYLFFKTIKEKE